MEAVVVYIVMMWVVMEYALVITGIEIYKIITK